MSGIRVIYKYEIGFGASWCNLPQDAEIVHCGAIAGKVYIWAIVDPNAPLLPQGIGFFATGGVPLPEDAEYIGTAIADGGDLVWHVMRHKYGEVV